MKKSLRARAFIIDGDRLLVMKRRIKGVEYHTLIGGGVEEDETPAQACLREIREETSLEVELIRELIRLDDFFNDIPYEHVIFLCRYKGGTPVIGGPEKLRSTPENFYEPVWISKNEIGTLPFRPNCVGEALKNKIIDIDNF